MQIIIWGADQQVAAVNMPLLNLPIPNLSQMVEIQQQVAGDAQAAAESAATVAGMQGDIDQAVADSGAAFAIALDADAKATEAQQVQARRDFSSFDLADYIDDEHRDLIRAGNWQDQDEVYVTSCIRNFNTVWLTWLSGGNSRMVRVRGLPGDLAMNAPWFGPDHAQMIWDMNGTNHGENRVFFEFPNTRIRIKNWLNLASERTTGRYAAQGVTGPVPEYVWEWEQSGHIALIAAFEGDLTIHGTGVLGQDPGGYHFYRTAKFKKQTMRARNLRNEGLFLEHCLNGDCDNVDLFRCGYQPTEYGGERGHLPFGVTFSNVGAVVTASVPTFDAGHVGKWFCLNRAGPTDQGIRLNFWSTIASVDSSTQITLTDTPAINRTGASGSFEAMRVTTSGTTWTMSEAITTSLAGRYVTLIGAMSSQPGAVGRTHKVRVLAHSGDTLTVDYAPAVDVTDALLVVSPEMSIDRLSYTSDQGISDNIGMLNLRCESTALPGVGCVQAVLGACSSISINNAKLHGLADADNNFGGAAAGIIFGFANGVMIDGFIEQSSHSPRWGTVMVTSDRTVVDLYGKLIEYAGDTHSALVHLDPPAGATNVQVGFGMIHPSPLFPQASQQVIRMGPNGNANMVTGGNSARRSATNAKFLFPERFGEIEASRITGAAATSTQTDGDATAPVPPLMRIGSGGNTGNVNPEQITDPNTIINRHRRVRMATGPGGVAIVIDAIRQVGSTTFQIGYEIGFNQPPRLIMRHNNYTGGAWGDWYYLDGTLLTP